MVALLEPSEAPVHPAEARCAASRSCSSARGRAPLAEAFRNAVKRRSRPDAGELAERAAAGTLQEIPRHREASTSGVIAQALAGELPAYLATLEASVGGPLVEGGEALRPPR